MILNGFWRPLGQADVRILFVYRFCGLGGVETSLLNRAIALRRLGHDVELLFGELYGDGGRYIKATPGVTVGLSREDTIAFLRRDFDVVSVADHPDFIEVLDAAVITAVVLFETHASAPAALDRLYRQMGSPRISAVVVPSVFNRDLVRAAGATNHPVHVLPNAVDTDHFVPNAGRNSTVDIPGFNPGTGPVVLWVGRLEDEKNPHEFLAIARIVTMTHPNVSFVMIGDSWNHDEYSRGLEGALDPLQRSRVTFVRTIDYAHMPAVFAMTAARNGCLVSTSLHESQPMVFLEAMACGCPIVTSDASGSGAIIRDGQNGWLYARGDIVAGAAAVARAIDPTGSGDRARLVANGRALVRNYHSLEATAAAFMTIAEAYTNTVPAALRVSLVTAVIIFLDGERFLREAIESVIHQTYPNWELMLVDDGSTDGSTAIAREFAARYPRRVTYLEHPGHQNRGKCASRNRGIAAGRGVYVAFLDHDDVWLPGKLEHQVDILERHPEVGMTYGPTNYWHSWTGRPTDAARDGHTFLGVKSDALHPPPTLLTLLLRDERTIASPCSVLIRRSVIDDVGGFDEAFDRPAPVIYEDVEFYARIYLSAAVWVSSACFDRYRQHASNSAVGALRTGEWHPSRPNVRKERLLLRIEAHVRRHGGTPEALRRALGDALRPYRNPMPRSALDSCHDACMDMALALVSENAALENIAGTGARGDDEVDAHRVAIWLYDEVVELVRQDEAQLRAYWSVRRAAVTGFVQRLAASTHLPLTSADVNLIIERRGANPWQLRAERGAQAEIKFHSIGVRVAIRSLGTAPHDLQLNWSGHSVVSGGEYCMTVRIRADTARRVSVGVARAHEPWDNLGAYHTSQVGKEWQDVVCRFAATDTDANARIHLDLGDSIESVEIASASLQPLVSVVLIFLNGERFLREAIESVLAQHYPYWELLLVDDGSGPVATAIAQEYAASHPKQIQYMDHDGHANLGMSATRNVGIAHAKGAYVAFLDADDVWLPTKLERQVDLFRAHPAAAMVYGAPLYWSGWTGDPKDVATDEFATSAITLDSLHPPPSMATVIYPLGAASGPCPSDLMVTRDALSRVGGFEETFRGFYEDQAFLIKMFLGESVFVSSETWTRYRIHPESCCSMIYRTGRYHSFRVMFLEWLGIYLRSTDPDAAVRAAYDAAFATARQQLREARWVLRVSNERVATLAFRDDPEDSVRVTMGDAAIGPTHDVQVNVPHFSVRKHHACRVAFTARADTPRPIDVGVAMGSAPWTGLGWHRTVNLTTEWQTVDERFMPTTDADDARVHFDVGGSSVPVEIAAVRLA